MLFHLQYSFIKEDTVAFYNLLWDSSRKSIDMITKLQKKNNLPGWRKLHNWHNDLKNKMRACEIICINELTLDKISMC